MTLITRITCYNDASFILDHTRKLKKKKIKKGISIGLSPTPRRVHSKGSEGAPANWEVPNKTGFDHNT